MERLLQTSTQIEAAFERVRELLLREPCALVAGPAAPTPTSRSAVVTLWAEWSTGAGATHDVVIEVGAPVLERDRASWPLRWRPTSHRRLLPPFAGMLQAARRPDGTAMRLEGGYEPPLGQLGAFGDGVVGHRLARSTAEHLLADISARIEQRIIAELDASGIRPAPYPPDLRDHVVSAATPAGVSRE